MATFGLRLYFFTLLGCIILTLVCGDKVPTNKSPGHRPVHRRPHNLHRAPYKGYDWYRTYELNLEPIRKESHKKTTQEDEKL
ncbi:uncharacterized protein LOC116654966 [Drosophila ananassae]|uniref:uncharacterized protein LOC116654966 n=1 Tax=Drosophila ananassae TaxID=7217 RepID=UPI0013A5C566|nr:uncharacterized protein LOC116654966 [Drosophila ananassae]